MTPGMAPEIDLKDQPTYALSRDRRTLGRVLGRDHHLVLAIESELRRRNADTEEITDDAEAKADA